MTITLAIAIGIIILAVAGGGAVIYTAYNLPDIFNGVSQVAEPISKSTGQSIEYICIALGICIIIWTVFQVYQRISEKEKRIDNKEDEADEQKS